uniref:Solute-binding protein family 5 domain-containing protein n=1 Tax=candidate division WOR-3 bacterium TaxID=2052148 RepID=A0A7V3VUI9_UNCW3
MKRSLFKIILFGFLISFCQKPLSDRVVVVYNRPPRTLDPHLRSEVVTISVLSNIYEGLIDYTPDLKLTPSLAIQWHQIDSLNWEFELRKNVFFHNGKMLNSEDVIYSLNRAFSLPKTEISNLIHIIDTIYAIDQTKFIIKTRFPYHYLLTELNSIYIVPNGYNDFDKPVGTGPYKIGLITDDSIICLANEQYWGKRPKIKKGIFKFVQDTENAIELLKKDIVNIVYGIPVEEYIKLKDSLRFAIHSGVSARYIQLNTKKSPFNLILLRQALSLAINRAEIVDRVYHSLAEPANQFIPKGVIGYIPEFPPLSFDPDSAERLLKNTGKRIKIRFYYGKSFKKIASMIAEYWRRIGIEVDEEELEPEKFFKGVEEGKFDCFLLSFLINSLDGLSGILEPSFHTSNPEMGEGMMNRAGYSNPEIDSLIDLAMVTADEDERYGIIKEIQKTLLNDMPVIPLVWEPRIYGLSKNIRFAPRLDQTIRFAEIGL